MTTAAASRTTADESAPTQNGLAAGPRRNLQTLALIVLLGIAVMRGLSPFYEPDLWWHLRVGTEILAGGPLYGTDPWASFADRPYMATQWLPEAVAAWTYGLTGVAGILWLRAMAILALSLTVYMAARQQSGRLASTVATALAVLGASASLNPRPQLLSFVLFSVVLLAWIRSARDHRSRWWLIPLFWLWACCHGLWAFGIVLGLLVTLSVCVDRRTRPTGRAMARLLGLNVACLAAITATPLGPRLLLSPLQVADNASWIAEEWRATPVNNAFAITAVILVLLTAVLWTRASATPLLWQIALLGLATALTLYMWRLVPLGSITAAPLFGSALQRFMPAPRDKLDAVERRTLIFGSTGAALLAAALCTTSIGTAAARYPGSMARIDAVLAEAPAKTVVFADFGVSGWLLWEHPDLVPAADLRMEIYGAHYLREYITASEGRPGWKDFVRRIKAKYAVLETDSALAGALQSEHWQVTARSPKFILLEAPEAHQ